jgi:L-ribulose-5-phosphate 4-epimerase
MRLPELRERVLEANLDVVRAGLVLFTFGNASGIDRDEGLVVIKPSGVPYEKMKPADLVITDLDGKVVEGSLRPSSDLDTHLVLYRAFPQIGGVVHTHSRVATGFAQALRAIPCLGTTHADYFHGPVPVTDHLTPEEVEADYEKATGDAIVRKIGAGADPLEVPAMLVAGHAPFAWGRTPAEAAHNAIVLEEVAAMAVVSLSVQTQSAELPRFVLDKHYYRKHGAKATYGQG